MNLYEILIGFNLYHFETEFVSWPGPVSGRL